MMIFNFQMFDPDMQLQMCGSRCSFQMCRSIQMFDPDVRIQMCRSIQMCGSRNVKFYNCGKRCCLKRDCSQAVAVRAFNPSTQEAEAGGTLLVKGQPGLQRVFQNRLQSYTEKLCLKNKRIVSSAFLETMFFLSIIQAEHRSLLDYEEGLAKVGIKLINIDQ